jgi:hypothetical protein
MKPIIPVVLFTYARPEHTKRVLDCLRENQVPLIYAFADGPKTPDVEPNVHEVRKMLHQVDWCEIHIVEREKNLGLGKSILAGVGEVFQKHEMIIVLEDDLIFVPGTYQYLCIALEHYKDDPNVMSVTGWTHPLVTPSMVKNDPYFDGRAECWSWGTWSRAWKGMERDSMSLVKECAENKIDVYRYGTDLLEMAKVEKEKNLWAVRFSYLHILHSGLCLRPPHSMVDHAGFDKHGTNATGESKWALNVLHQAPPIPQIWPSSVENPQCPALWQTECGVQPTTKGNSLSRFMVRAFERSRRVLTKRRLWRHL